MELNSGDYILISGITEDHLRTYTGLTRGVTELQGALLCHFQRRI